MAQIPNDEDEKPLDPAVERVRRRVMRFIAINLGILFVALMAVAIAIVYRIDAREEAAAPETGGGGESVAAEGTIALPEDARIVSQSLSDGRLSVQVALPGGEAAFLIYDLASGEVVSRVAVESGQ
ncbi:MAG: fimbrial protein [Rhizobiaceae bacterium]|nr:fimbrial protein [Rhizobiaceae bacterium]